MLFRPSLIMFAAVAASIAATVVFVLGFRLWSRREARRSPLLARQVGHVPGQQLVARVSDSQDDLLLSVIFMYFAVPTMLLAWAMARVPAERFKPDATLWMYAVGAACMFGWGMRDYIKHWRRRQQARDGLLAERVTGMQLNRLLAQGCIVMHDLPAEGFNIDHVVIAARGVYAVETKSFRKPKASDGTENYAVVFDGQRLKFPDFVEVDAPGQAQRQAQWLSRVLREALGREVRVIPALALPGWRVDQSEAVWRSAAVKVFSPMRNGSNFMAKGIEVIDSATRNLVKEALAVRYPVVQD
ncbi:MAG: NERD domain-containing protein [Burkholderiales bacterium]|nr:MAG: NERD domain-containing protein [Burkholderiales bacterium]